MKPLKNILKRKQTKLALAMFAAGVAVAALAFGLLQKQILRLIVAMLGVLITISATDQLSKIVAAEGEQYRKLKHKKKERA